jgi:hypothetical protein
MINLIGISGKMGNGKDTVANIIQYLTRNYAYIDYSLEQYNQLVRKKDWEVKSFAEKLKQISADLTGLPLETFKTQEGKLTVLDSMWDYYTLEYDNIFFKTNTYQEILDKIGEIVLNHEEANFFISKIKHHQMTVREVLQLVGTDCMRDNLHQNVWVNSLFANYQEDSKWLISDTRFLNEAKSIKDRGGIILRVNRQLESNTNSHPSETSLDEYNFDYVINNDGTLEDLIEETYKFLKHYQII